MCIVIHKEIFTTTFVCFRQQQQPRRQRKQQQQQQQQTAPRGGRNNNNADFESQIANGEIPGVPGKDYPVNSVQALKGRFANLQVAPADLIINTFPGGQAIKGKNLMSKGRALYTTLYVRK